MRILTVADTEDKALWDYYDKNRLGPIDLILSGGDLKPAYLEFLVTMTNADLYYVRGNHDGIYAKEPPGGGIDIDGKLVTVSGLRILGLGGCMRYKNGPDMYDEKEMTKRIRKLKWRLKKAGGVDILLTHAPAKGFGDQEDLCHQGFSCFADLLDTYHPAYMIHGHVHKEYGHFVRERLHPGGTRIVNACGYHILETEG